jgi:hypothetical protein
MGTALTNMALEFLLQTMLVNAERITKARVIPYSSLGFSPSKSGEVG